MKLAPLIAALPLAANAAPPGMHSYQCGEITAELAPSGTGARLRIGGQYLDLTPTPTASGAKYARDEGTFLWTRGDSALLSLDGTDYPECQRVAPAPYTARGNEPGWTLTLTETELHYLGDYGATEITAPLPQPEPINGALHYAAPSLTVTLSPSLCHDDMTGMPYPQGATIETEQTVLHGCGGTPMDLLTAHPWTVTEIDGTPTAPATVTLTVTPEGRISGKGGCNRYTGQVALTGEGLQPGPVAATKMACPEPLMATEARFFDALARTHRFDIAADGTLHLIASGNPAIRARR